MKCYFLLYRFPLLFLKEAFSWPLPVSHTLLLHFFCLYPFLPSPFAFDALNPYPDQLHSPPLFYYTILLLHSADSLIEAVSILHHLYLLCAVLDSSSSGQLNFPPLFSLLSF